MGLFSVGEKNISETNNYDQSTTIDQSIGAGGGANSVNLGAGATYTTSDPAVTQAALDAMTSGNSAALNTVRDLSTVNGWLQLFGLQSGLGAMGATSSEAMGRMERLAGKTTAAGLSLAGDVVDRVLGNEGKALAGNAEATKQAFLTAQSLSNNAQNLGMGAFATATNLAGNAFGAASHIADVGAAQNMALGDRNADLLQSLGSGAFSLADSIATHAAENANTFATQVLQSADANQSRMADLVTASQEYNTNLAKTAATGGASDMLKTFMWVAIAGLAAFAISRK